MFLSDVFTLIGAICILNGTLFRFFRSLPDPLSVFIRGKVSADLGDDARSPDHPRAPYPLPLN